MVESANRRVVLGVAGGVAAYKSADLVRRLRERGCAVRVVLTRGGQEFITGLTLQALSGHPVHQDLLDPAAEAAMGHIELARWADLVLIAPATAHVLAKLAGGLADDLLSTLCLATKAPIAVAPAMNQQMWAAAPTQRNVAVLVERGVSVIGPAEGEQACGDVGPGRMVEPLAIVQRLLGAGTAGSMSGLSVLVTAGPTREAIDPVRYISNHSSGKMGYAVAGAAVDAGARVTLVSGPTSLDPPPGVDVVWVTSAQDMRDAVMARVAHTHIVVAAAAVADYRPAEPSEQKIKKSDSRRALEMVPTPDILAELGSLESRPFLVGFAAETEKVAANARAKLKRKSLDLIAANRVGVPGVGFGADENELTVYWSRGARELGLASKLDLARRLIALIGDRYRATHPA